MTFKISMRDRLIIAGIIALTLLIPTGAYVLSLRAKSQSSAQEYKTPVTSPKAEATSSSRLQDALNRLEAQSDSTSSTQTTTEDGTDGLTDSQLILGPTLGFSLVLQGRPLDNQSTRAFLGIAAGSQTTRPTYLLSFMVNVPASGAFDGISLSGLETGQTYTAYLKGESQIATASSFTVKATPTNLGALNLITGDVNEDNVIDNTDYNLVKASVGATPSSSKWNPLYDFNLDNVINSWDLNTVLTNLTKIGASGAWYSYSPISSGSATLNTNTNVIAVSRSPGLDPGDAAISTGSTSAEIEPGTQEPKTNFTNKKGYWMWVPN